MANPEITEMDFEKAKHRAKIQSIFSTFTWKNPDLLSLYDVTKLVKPEAEFYRGMQTIPVAKIIGSENRYHDFSAAFYPKSNLLRHRWESIDSARLDNVILPPISVYQVGEVYFVRDGNHRVSVAKSEGQDFIDAEVVELSTAIKLEEGMTMNELRKRVVDYERIRFLEQYHPDYLPMDKIVFTTPGSYPEMVNHILVHKYYANEKIPDRELTFKEAAVSWYENVYSKVVGALDQEHLLQEYPGQTEADCYMWLVKRWDEMKRHGDSYITEEEAAKLMKKEGEKEAFSRWREYILGLFSRK